MKINGEGRLEQVKGKDGKQKQTVRDGRLVFVWRGRFNLGYNKETERYVHTPWRTFSATRAMQEKGWQITVTS